jgi:hypothetical protein
MVSRGGMIKTIFVGVILAVVLGMATSQVISNMPGTESHDLAINGEGADNLDVGYYETVENGTVTVEYDMSAADNINVTLNSQVVLDQEISGSGTIENSVDSYIQEGNNELSVSLDGGTSNVNSLATTLDVSLGTDTLGVIDTARSMGPTIVTFIFLGLLVLAIVGLIRYFRAV